jgi:hypothetical protein
VGTATVGTSGSWAITTTPLTNGVHVLTATQSSGSAVSAASAALSLQIDTTPPVLTADSPLTSGAAATVVITPAMLQFNDAVSTHAQETYSIISAPADGTLLKNGSPTSSFTQADIDNGLISYQETTSNASSDSFGFTVSDVAGNTTAAEQFQIQVVPPATPLQFVGASDLSDNGDGALFWESGGNPVLWTNNGMGFTQVDVTSAHTGSQWTAIGTGEDSAGQTEMFWLGNINGQLSLSLWQFNNGGSFLGVVNPSGDTGAEWHIAALADFNGDGNTDALWVSTSGVVSVWSLNGGMLLSAPGSNQQMPSGWNVVAVGDFYGTGRDSLLLEGPGGQLQSWSMNGATVAQTQTVGQVGAEWRVAGVGSFAGDGNCDLVVVNTANEVTISNMQNGVISGPNFALPALDGSDWRLQAVGDFNGDGHSQLLWMTAAGATQLWEINGTQVTVETPTSPTGDILQLAPASAVPLGTSAAQAPIISAALADTVVGFGDPAPAASMLSTATSGATAGTIVQTPSATTPLDLSALATNSVIGVTNLT